eukprot:386992-Alexandrium_andersonii.AAC.1
MAWHRSALRAALTAPEVKSKGLAVAHRPALPVVEGAGVRPVRWSTLQVQICRLRSQHASRGPRR